MPARHSASILLLSVVLGLPAPGAELPEATRKEIEAARKAYENTWAAADKTLMEAFDSEVELIRKQTSLSAEDRRAAIDAIGVEKETFEKDRTIPLSSRMRAASMNYLNAVRQLRRPAAAAYDKGIDHLTRAKDDAAATLLVAEKAKMIGPKIVAHLSFTSVDGKRSFTKTLLADGTGTDDKQTWALSKDRLVITTPDAKAPKGAWVDTCTFNKDGQTFQVRTQSGGAFAGKRLDRPKD